MSPTSDNYGSFPQEFSRANSLFSFSQPSSRRKADPGEPRGKEQDRHRLGRWYGPGTFAGRSLLVFCSVPISRAVHASFLLVGYRLFAVRTHLDRIQSHDCKDKWQRQDEPRNSLKQHISESNSRLEGPKRARFQRLVATTPPNCSLKR